MSNEFELRVINKPIYYVEMIALLNRIANSRTYKEMQFTREQLRFLDVLQGLRVKGCELFEFYLYHETLDNIEDITKALKGYNSVDFLYLLCGEVFEKREIELIIKDFDAIYKIAQKSEYLSGHDWKGIGSAFENPEVFVDGLIDILQMLDSEVRGQLEKQDLYKESIAKISLDLKSKVPLDVAQGIMGKKFKRVFDFTTYYFVPSYYFMNRPMRTFNEKTQIVIYPVQVFNTYDKNRLANALKIIGDNMRLDMIRKLSVRPMFGKELAKELGISTSTVSHHLEQLRSIGLIHEEREKNTKYFSINSNEYNQLCDTLKNFIIQDKTK